MNKKHLFLLSAFVLIGCSPSVTVKEDKIGAYSALSADAQVDILDISENTPSHWVRVGEAYFGDTGFTLGCGLDKMKDLAKQNARAMGANAFKIIEHKTPDLLSSCHRIKVVYYRKVGPDAGAATAQENAAVSKLPEDKTGTASEQAEKPVAKPKNTVAVGYQIGGTTLIGIDHEIRVSESFGVHFGGGLAGFGGGVRFHTGPETHSSYYDLNYKDGGFGLFETVAFQFGGLMKMGNESGLRYEIGIQKPLFIKKSFQEKLFGNKKVPPVILAIGIGWGW